MLWPRLQKLLGTPGRTMHMISPYFVPGDGGTERLTAFARGGVEVSVLTNALEATDVVAVHAGYARRRAALLKAKVALYELKRAPARTPGRRRFRAGSSRSSLHAKSFVVDGKRVFVGSFNFDPRSARLNTEMGFVIDSPAMAAVVADAFRSDIPARGYAVQLNASGRMQWVEQTETGPRVHAAEPGAGFWLRNGIAVLSRLPIEWLL
jgi:putative cardiolipin synthase